MVRILSRLESGERWWAAEIVLRALGLALLGLCAAASLWLYRSMHQPPTHEPHVLEWAGAVVVFVSWSAGGALLTVGPGLFERIEVPARYARFPLTKGPE
jgi:hypothetical protein